jgi:hypothetical protein
MSLRGIKEQLNFDQQNILACTVVKDFDTFTNIRTPKGENVRASKGDGLSFTAGTSVEVRTDKRTYAIVGNSNYSEYSADRDYEL